MCDPQLRMTNIVAEWPGSTHDSFMWQNSALYHRMMANNMGWLLGDSGYPLSPVLHTPVARPNSHAEDSYNAVYINEREILQKELSDWDRWLSLQSKPDTCVKIVTACAVLHNISINEGISDLTNTHTRLTALCLGLPRLAGTRKVKPIWILLKQETVSGSGISWASCKSAHRSRQITTPASSVFYRPDALPVTQPTVSNHWRGYLWPDKLDW